MTTLKALLIPLLCATIGLSGAQIAKAQGPPLQLGKNAQAPPNKASAQNPAPEPEAFQETHTGPRNVIWILSMDSEEADQKNDKGFTLLHRATSSSLRLLDGSKDKHIVASKGQHLTAWTQRTGGELPPCLRGTAPCSNPIAVWMDTLNAQLLVRGKLVGSGARWRFEVELYGPDGRRTLTRTFQASADPGAQGELAEKAIDELISKAARELFEATGTLTISTTPPGSTLFMDGKEIGESPLTSEVPVGLHEIRAEKAGYSQAQNSVKIVSGKSAQINLKLAARLGTLLVDSTPVLGEVFVDGEHKGSAGEPFQIPPGAHEIEIRAEGYKTRYMQALVEPEEKKIVALTLEPRRPTVNVKGLGEVETEAILSRRYFGRVGYRTNSLTTGLSKSAGTFERKNVTLEGLTLNGELQSGLQTDLGLHGLHMETGYFWDKWGVSALGLTVTSSGDTATGQIQRDGGPVSVELDNFSRVEFKPAQLMYRHPYKNLIPMVQVGLGYANTSFQGKTPENEIISFEQDGFFWNFSVEATYFLDTWWFAHASLGIHRDISHDDSDTQTFFGFGLGMTFEDPLSELGLRNNTAPPRSYEEENP